MAARLSLQCTLLACLGRFIAAQPASVDLPYTLEHPYEQPANGNGLTVEKPNMIIFMPDQLRYDSVGIFGSDVSLHQRLKPALFNAAYKSAIGF